MSFTIQVHTCSHTAPRAGTGKVEMGSLDHVCSRHLLINANLDDVSSQLSQLTTLHSSSRACLLPYLLLTNTSHQ